MTRLNRTNTIRTAALAAALSVAAGGAFAQGAGSAATTLGYSAGQPYARQGAAVPRQRPLTAMGMTGGIEPKHPETTGSIVSRPTYRRLGPVR